MQRKYMRKSLQIYAYFLSSIDVFLYNESNINGGHTIWNMKLLEDNYQ